MYRISNYLIQSLQPKIRWLYKNYSIPRGIVYILDNLAVFGTFLIACFLRYNLDPAAFSLSHAVRHALLTLVVYALFSLIFRAYTGLIRHTTIEDILQIFIFTSSSFFVLLGSSLAGRHLWPDHNLVIPVSILIIHYILITLWLSFFRIGIKVIYQSLSDPQRKKKRVLVYGAGAMGIIVKRVLQSDEISGYQIAGFIDEKRSLHGKKIDGLPVFNPKVLTPLFIQAHALDVMIFAIKEIAPARKSEILASALSLGLEILEPPTVDTWLNGSFQMNQMKKVRLEDLLGREPIQLNMRKIGVELSGKTILVTGAAGSIGSEIVRQLTQFRIGNLVLIDQAETPMFHLDKEMRNAYNRCQVKMILGDVTNIEQMEQVFQTWHPQIVFHAAAYKHVPMMEENPHEAIRVNVGGTRILTGLSMRYGVEKFVMISTDKAVNPTNVMGASKRICEMIVQCKAHNPGNTGQFIVTRFGNVLGSNGSVIPIFRKQIEEGGPVTVTHPRMTRYFMTIPEACQLVLEAGCMAKGGEIFVFDMGNPVRIADLASQMIRLSGFIPGQDIQIVYTGLRPGEKLYEELFTTRENTRPTHHSKIKIASVERQGNADLLEKIEYLLYNLYTLSKQEVVDYCHDLVPEYKSTNGNYVAAAEKKSIQGGKVKSGVGI